MNKDYQIRWNWLKFMYVYTIVLPGITGITVIFAPELYLSMYGWPPQDQYLLGITGSMWLTFAILASFGLRNPQNSYLFYCFSCPIKSSGLAVS